MDSAVFLANRSLLLSKNAPYAFYVLAVDAQKKSKYMEAISQFKSGVAAAKDTTQADFRRQMLQASGTLAADAAEQATGAEKTAYVNEAKAAFAALAADPGTKYRRRRPPGPGSVGNHVRRHDGHQGDVCRSARQPGRLQLRAVDGRCRHRGEGESEQGCDQAVRGGARGESVSPRRALQSRPSLHARQRVCAGHSGGPSAARGGSEQPGQLPADRDRVRGAAEGRIRPSSAPPTRSPRRSASARTIRRPSLRRRRQRSTPPRAFRRSSPLTAIRPRPCWILPSSTTR